MTGGSSLIPVVQDRLRSMFPHLDDELAFVAGTPGDVESERRALTGVSRGLARFGFLESFEAGSPCTFSVFVPDRPRTRAVCLERGAPDVLDLDESPPVRLEVQPGQRSIVVHSDLVRETYCGAVADAALPAGEVEVRLSASRERFAPAFVVRRPDTAEEIGRFDLDGMAPVDVEHWVEGDHEWVPLSSSSPRSAFLTRPLELGDFVEWWNGNSLHQGKIVQIRHVSSGRHVQRMEGFDPSPYVIRAAAERNGSVLFGQVTEKHWRSGDLRLA
jgi:hypothetical protein